ncbi:MAG TPA: anti-sigma factor [Ktedonobacteraceae bacterium]|nr:anti-sigma factor [Ktedonobacteraceae bacterium]
MANNTTISCQEFVEMVTDYLENVLLPEARKQFVEHKEACPGCETYLEQIQQTITTLRKIGEEEDTPETKQKLLHVFRQWQSQKK